MAKVRKCPMCLSELDIEDDYYCPDCGWLLIAIGESEGVAALEGTCVKLREENIQLKNEIARLNRELDYLYER